MPDFLEDKQFERVVIGAGGEAPQPGPVLSVGVAEEGHAHPEAREGGQVLARVAQREGGAQGGQTGQGNAPRPGQTYLCLLHNSDLREILVYTNCS